MEDAISILVLFGSYLVVFGAGMLIGRTLGQRKQQVAMEQATKLILDQARERAAQSESWRFTVETTGLTPPELYEKMVREGQIKPAD